MDVKRAAANLPRWKSERFDPHLFWQMRLFVFRCPGFSSQLTLLTQSIEQPHTSKKTIVFTLLYTLVDDYYRMKYNWKKILFLRHGNYFSKKKKISVVY